MALLLLIESSSNNCSVAISRNGTLECCIEKTSEQYIHAESLHPFLKELFATAQCRIEDLDAIAVSKGPGSYTGLRIGVSAAKGLCFATNIPLMGIGTTSILASYGKRYFAGYDYYCPMIDAKRMEVYCALYDAKGNLVENDEAQILSTAFFERWKGKSILFIGDGAEKCRPFISRGNEIEACVPSATMMSLLAEDRFSREEFDDVAYMEPFYLKDYMPGISTKSVL